MKEFKSDFNILLERINKGKPFAFSKYADGEYGIMKGISIGNKEFQHNPSDIEAQNRLLDSFKYKHKDYYVGIGCPCCMGDDSFEDMKEMSAVDFFKESLSQTRSAAQ